MPKITYFELRDIMHDIMKQRLGDNKDISPYTIACLVKYELNDKNKPEYETIPQYCHILTEVSMPILDMTLNKDSLREIFNGVPYSTFAYPINSFDVVTCE